MTPMTAEQHEAKPVKEDRTCPYCKKPLKIIRWTTTWSSKTGEPMNTAEEYACIDCNVVFVEESLPDEYEIVEEAG